MRQETEFDPRSDLIIVEAYVSGPRGTLPVSLALDTGSSATVIVPDTLDEIGYSPRDGQVITTVTSAVGQEQGYILRLAGFEALGFTEADFLIHAFDLANRYGIDGVIGLNFLEKLNYEIRSAEGRILAEKIGP
jgi:predicted aspartyl protease